MSIRATDEERVESFPGDSLVPNAKLVSTHAITIAADPSSVWPWVAQIGQRRGGFYSYTMLENLLGCRMQNADRIHPEWQDRNVGDPVHLHPKAEPMAIAEIEPERLLAIRAASPLSWSWVFLLKQATCGCRLLVRTRVRWNSWLAGLVWRPVMGPGHYLMERRMLRGIRHRVEDAVQAAAAND